MRWRWWWFLVGGEVVVVRCGGCRGGDGVVVAWGGGVVLLAVGGDEVAAVEAWWWLSWCSVGSGRKLAGKIAGGGGRRVRESGVKDRVDRVIRTVFGFAEKRSPEKFSGGGGVVAGGGWPGMVAGGRRLGEREGWECVY
nr:hypothetical protein [Tanacetum cinerariifolium]